MNTITKLWLVLMLSMIGHGFARAQTIATGPISGSSFSQGDSVYVPFTIIGSFNSGNVFTAQLSDAAGAFGAPVSIGTRTGTSAGTVAAVIPIATPTGTGYRIRVVASAPVVQGSDNGSNIAIVSCLPASFSTSPGNQTASAATGACTAAVSYTATTAGSPAATISYSFSGATTGSGAGTGSGTNFNIGVTNVTLTATNGCGVSATAGFTVTVNAPEINLQGGTPATNIADGATVPATGNKTDFGSVAIGSTASSTYTIQNTGTLALSITGITAIGGNTGDFAITGVPLTVPASGSATFTVAFTPSATGLRSTTIHVSNNDCDEADYDFAIQGTGSCATPTAFTVTGGGAYCAGGSGKAVGLGGSETGVTYQLYNGITTVGSPVAGNGSAISFGNQTAAGIYTVVATRTAGACTNNMTGNVPISINALPAASITGSTTICAGSSTNITFSGTPNATVNYTVNGGSNQNIVLDGTGSATLSPSLSATATYTIVNAVSTALCTNPISGQSATITVNPIPDVTATPAAQATCGAITAIALTGTVSGTVYNWSRDHTTEITGLNATGSGNNISGTLANTTTTPATTIFTITPSYTNAGKTCTGAPITATITVNPTPVLATPTAPTICSGSLVSINNSVSNSVNATFSWTAVNGTNISGAHSNSGTTISDVLTNSVNTATGTATYTITPAYNGLPACAGAAVPVTVTVNPIPAYNGPASTYSCSGSGTAITLSATSPAAGNTFAWSVANARTILTPTAGSGASIAQTLFTPVGTTTPDSVTYSVIPTFTNNGVGCAGSATPVTNTVNPVPALTTNPNPSAICSGSVPGISLSATTAAAKTSYSWTIGANPGNISGASPSTGISNIPQTLTNPDSVFSASVIYNVTPVYTNGSACSGNPVPVNITVKPKPIYNGPSSIGVCSGSSVNAVLSATTPFASNSFSWTIGPVTSGITGAAPFNGSTITQALSNPTNNTVGTVIYNVTPKSASCAGDPVPVTVYVNPLPQYNGPTNPPAICSGMAINVALSATTPAANNSFNWTLGANPGNIGNASPGSGMSIVQNLTNPSTSAAASIVYNVTPTFTANGKSCPAASATPVTVTVNPAGILSPSLSNITICSGTNPNIVLSSSAGASHFAWTVPPGSISAGITGASDDTGAVINQALTNASNTSPGTVQYNVTASTASGCAGGSASYTVHINPLPNLTSAAKTTKSICSGTGTQIQLGATTGNATYTWVASSPSGSITGFSDNPNYTAGLDVIGQTLTSSNHQFTDSVIYFVTAKSAEGCASASAEQIKVRVYPTPSVLATDLTAVCSNKPTSIALNATTPSAFSWVVDSVSSNITGATQSGGNIIAQTLVNADTAAAGFVKYIVTAKSDSLACLSQPKPVIVTVRALPTVNFPYSFYVLCSDQQTNISLSSSIIGSLTPWTTGNSSLGLVSGNFADTLTTIIQKLTNSTHTTSDTVTYIVQAIDTSAGLRCAGAQKSIRVAVNPLPEMNSVTTKNICSQDRVNYTPTASTGAGATFTWTLGPVSGSITGGRANSVFTTLINDSLVNGSNATTGSQNYIISTKSAVGCNAATPGTLTVNVAPLPVLTSIRNITICSDSILVYQPTSSVTAGTTIFTYNRTSPSPTIANLFGQKTTGISDTLSTHFSLDPISVDYNFLLASAVGCKLGEQHLTVTVNPTPDMPGISVFPAKPVCNDARAMNFSTSRMPDPREYFRWSTINAGVPIQKADSSNSQNALISFPNAGNTTVVVESFSRAFGCKSKPSTMPITVRTGSGAQNVNVVLFSNNLVAQTTGAKAYQWGFDRRSDLDSTLLDGAIYQNYDTRNGFNTTDNYYWVMVTFGDDCVQKAYFNGPTLGIQSATTRASSGMKVYPNPVQDILTVELTEHNFNDLSFEVYDLTGKRLYQAHSNTARARIPVADLAPGYYTIICTQEGMRIATSRFIKN